MAKHEEHEEHENHERWLVSYADFITLLFAFFVVMYAVSRVDQQRAIQVEQSVKWALHIAGDGGSGDRVLAPGLLPGARSLEVVPSQSQKVTSSDSVVESTKRKVEARMGAMSGRGRPKVLVLVEGTKLVVRMSALGLFDAGESTILPSAIPTLDAALASLAELPGDIRVEGHTDTDGSSSSYDENWSLSARRAAAVVAYAQHAHHVPAARLSAVGFGSTRPLADNTSAEGRARNRRVELVIDAAVQPQPTERQRRAPPQ
jgi:chemotaxis protein MotB